IRDFCARSLSLCIDAAVLMRELPATVGIVRASSLLRFEKALPFRTGSEIAESWFCLDEVVHYSSRSTVGTNSGHHFIGTAFGTRSDHDSSVLRYVSDD